MAYAKYSNVAQRFIFEGEWATVLTVVGSNEYLIKTDSARVYRVSADSVHYDMENVVPQFSKDLYK